MSLLAATPKEIVKREALRINPAKTCQPIGAMYASLGIHNCLNHSHGSQGCCSFHRSHLTRHYREPIIASTSSFTEGASVFGGGPNLRQALNTIFTTYNPDIVAINTTCLSETIGDDIPTYIEQAREEGVIPDGKYVIHCNTPSYVGSHITGWSNMVTGMVKYLSEKTEPKPQLNVIPGYVEPSDVRHLKQLLKHLGVKSVVFPDTSDVVDAPQTGTYQMFPKGGVTIEQLKSTGDSLATIACGGFASEAAALALQDKCQVPAHVVDLPIGIQATDRFVQKVMDLTGVTPPDELDDERGRLVDIMTDMQQYLYRTRVAVYGDPDQLVALTEFLVACGMCPAYVITGSPVGKRFEERVKEILKDWVPDAVVAQDADLFYLHQLIKNDPVDLLIGNEYGKYIGREEDIPLVRFGFPILDRVGHSYFPTFGYRGGMHLLCNIVNTLLERLDRDAPDHLFELVR